MAATPHLNLTEISNGLRILRLSLFIILHETGLMAMKLFLATLSRHTLDSTTGDITAN
jgi:hypothetical protein